MKKKIRNKAVRRVLRTIANWDNCPVDCRRNWQADLLRYFGCVGVSMAITALSIAFIILFI